MSHDHGGHATTSAMPAATGVMDHGGAHDHSSHGGGGCEISMLWNWTTINSCFIAESWKINSRGMFAGSCIGVVLLGITLELLRRSVKEYDRFLLRQHRARSLDAVSAPTAPSNGDVSESGKAVGAVTVGAACVSVPPFRPSVWQQAIRATLHMVQFAVAYFLMLLAMYYNGYIIICIFIGIYIGGFIFQWEALSDGENSRTSASNEATVCCG